MTQVARGAAGIHGFSMMLTSFVGRADEVGHVAGLLADHRLVTVAGPGGVGKTRLATEIAQRVADRYADGVWLVELASVADPALVATAVAGALGLHLTPRQPVTDSLITMLARQQLLLVLDNCEHLLSAVAELCGKLLPAADDVRVLATSREPLGLAGESRYRLGPLRLPPPHHAADHTGAGPAAGYADPGHGPGDTGPGHGAEDTQPGHGAEDTGADADDTAGYAACESVALFADRAQMADPGFSLGPETGPAAARVVARLDGMPLAIELAAARVEALGVTQLADLLDDGFRLLVGTDRLAPGRHRTLAATAEWSYRLLGQREQAVFRMLTVFPGPFTLDGAEAVAGRDAGQTVLHLVDCSLLAPPQDRADGRPRYRMLETLRGYGADRLAENGEEHAVAVARLAGYALRVAEQGAAVLETSTGELNAARWLDAEDPTVHRALAWALDHDPATALRLALALAPWWSLRARHAAGYKLLAAAAAHATEGGPQWCAAQIWLALMAIGSRESLRLGHYTAACDSLAAGPPSPLLAWALAGRAGCLSNLGRVTEARQEASRALALARELADPAGEARALRLLGLTAHYAGDIDASLDWLRQAQRIDPAAIPGRVLRECLSMLTLALIEVRELDEARRTGARGLALARRAGVLRDQGNSLLLMAQIDLLEGRLPEAAADVREAVKLTARTGYGVLLVNCLDQCGHLCERTQRPADAIAVWAAYAACLRDSGMPDLPLDREWRREPMRRARQSLGPGRARAAEQRGASMGQVTAAEYALMLATAEPADQPGPAASLPRLSARERELVTLVAQGHTNSQIAGQLFISIRTVGSHLDRIRDKTGCRRRADLTRLALEAGLV